MNDSVSGSGMTSIGSQKKQTTSSSTLRSSSPNNSIITAPVSQTSGSSVQGISRLPSNDFVFDSQEIRCKLISSESSNNNVNSQTEAADLLPITMSILIDNENEVKPVLHEAIERDEEVKPISAVQEPISANNAGVKLVEQDSGMQDKEEEIFSSPEGVPEEPKKMKEIGGKDETELTKSKSGEDETQGQKDDIQTTNDIPKKDVNDEPYKIDIPLRKNVNRSTQKKLWREIEKRKPFITQNVAMHIQKYAKPPFITWGCKGCKFPYEIQSYSKEYWQQ